MKKLLTALCGLLFPAGIVLLAGGCEKMRFEAIVGGLACLIAAAVISNLCGRDTEEGDDVE